eukprot:4688570-Pleurochrysis_carterae.AAC.1
MEPNREGHDEGGRGKRQRWRGPKWLKGRRDDDLKWEGCTAGETGENMPFERPGCGALSVGVAVRVLL